MNKYNRYEKITEDPVRELFWYTGGKCQNDLHV